MGMNDTHSCDAHSDAGEEVIISSKEYASLCEEFGDTWGSLCLAPDKCLCRSCFEAASSWHSRRVAMLRKTNGSEPITPEKDANDETKVVALKRSVLLKSDVISLAGFSNMIGIAEETFNTNLKRVQIKFGTIGKALDPEIISPTKFCNTYMGGNHKARRALHWLLWETYGYKWGSHPDKPTDQKKSRRSDQTYGLYQIEEGFTGRFTPLPDGGLRLLIKNKKMKKQTSKEVCGAAFKRLGKSGAETWLKSHQPDMLKKVKVA